MEMGGRVNDFGRTRVWEGVVEIERKGLREEGTQGEERRPGHSHYTFFSLLQNRMNDRQWPLPPSPPCPARPLSP